MARHRTDLTRGVPLPSTWVNALMEFLSNYVSSNLRVTHTDTQVTVSGMFGDERIAMAVGAKWRWNEGAVTVTHPGGAAGIYDLWVTAYANDLSATDPADATNYAFGATIRARVAGLPSPPAATGATAHSRRIAEMQWTGTKIIGLKVMAGAPRPSYVEDVRTTEVSTTSNTTPITVLTTTINVPTGVNRARVSWFLPALMDPGGSASIIVAATLLDGVQLQSHVFGVQEAYRIHDMIYSGMRYFPVTPGDRTFSITTRMTLSGGLLIARVAAALTVEIVL